MEGSALEGLTLRQITIAGKALGLTYGEMVAQDMMGELDRERVLSCMPKQAERAAAKKDRMKRCSGCRHFRIAGGMKLCCYMEDTGELRPDFVDGQCPVKQRRGRRRRSERKAPNG